jgi:hypothetical protein
MIIFYFACLNEYHIYVVKFVIFFTLHRLCEVCAMYLTIKIELWLGYDDNQSTIHESNEKMWEWGM